MSVSVKGQPWLESQATGAVMRALEAAGGAGCARFVGGCVRNSLLGQPVDDIDIATRLQPSATMAALISVTSRRSACRSASTVSISARGASAGPMVRTGSPSASVPS